MRSRRQLFPPGIFTFPEKYGIGNTSAEFEEELIPRLEGIDKLVFDFAEPDHISSAGLRVVLSALQLLDSRGGSMIIKNASDGIKKVFKLTGFLSIIDFR